jgi:hypothetical protein
MSNHYEAPEIVEIGEVEDVILGLPKPVDRFDSVTQEFNFDPTILEAVE